MIIYDKLTQGTDEWFALRRGKLTASNAQTIATSGRGMETLCFALVAELITGRSEERYSNSDMERGHELEPLARVTYELETGIPVREVGFVELDPFTGCSPDGLVGKEGLMEIKCKNDANFLRFIYDKKIDKAHDWQMQMQMLVTGRNWCDYVLFNNNFEENIIITRVKRDEYKIKQIQSGLRNAIGSMKGIMDKIKYKKE